jgi:hypothetical protein
VSILSPVRQLFQGIQGTMTTVQTYLKRLLKQNITSIYANAIKYMANNFTRSIFCFRDERACDLEQVAEGNSSAGSMMLSMFFIHHMQRFI